MVRDAGAGSGYLRAIDGAGKYTPWLRVAQKSSGNSAWCRLRLRGRMRSCSKGNRAFAHAQASEPFASLDLQHGGGNNLGHEGGVDFAERAGCDAVGD